MSLYETLGVHTRHACGCLEGTEGTIPCDEHEGAWATAVAEANATCFDLERELDDLIGFDPAAGTVDQPETRAEAL